MPDHATWLIMNEHSWKESFGIMADVCGDMKVLMIKIKGNGSWVTQSGYCNWNPVFQIYLTECLNTPGSSSTHTGKQKTLMAMKKSNPCVTVSTVKKSPRKPQSCNAFLEAWETGWKQKLLHWYLRVLRAPLKVLTNRSPWIPTNGLHTSSFWRNIAVGRGWGSTKW